MQWSSFMPAALFSVTSISMILLNKWVVQVYPYSATLLILQNCATIALLWAKNPQQKLEKETLQAWLPCAVIFCVNIFSSMESLTSISVPTFTIFRNTQPLIAVALDFWLRKQSITYASFHFLVMVLIGAVIYCKHDTNVSLYGYVWAAVHVLSMSLYSVVVKSKCETLNLSVSDMSMYNNVLSLPVLLLLGLASHVAQRDSGNSQLDASYLCVTVYLCVLPILISCVAGYAMSLAGFNAQKAMSPISFLTLNNLSKIPAIIISVFLFNTVLTMTAIYGMGVSMIAGYLYALSRQQDISFVIVTIVWSMVSVITYVAFFI